MTTKESVIKGNSATFLVAGSGTDTAVTRGTNGQIPYGNPTNSQVTATLVEKHAPYELTGFNIFASQGDQKAVMRKASMNVINRDIDLVCLAELANATIDTGGYATASLAMVEKAKGYLANNDIPTEEEDNMFAVVSGGFMAYLRQTTEFASHDYVDVKPLVGPDPQDAALGRRQLGAVGARYRRRHLHRALLHVPPRRLRLRGERRRGLDPHRLR
jgi:hypothetical protein